MKNGSGTSNFTPGRNQLNLFFISIPCLILGFSSCLTPRFYTPNRNPVPLFTHKGDIYTDISTNAVNKADVTMGYALCDGLAGYAGFGMSSESSLSFLFRPETSFNTEGQIQNYGLGYFLSQKKSERFRFELFGDMGIGKYKITLDPNPDYSYRPVGKTAYLSGQYRKIGALMNIGYSGNERLIQYGYTARFSNLKFYNTSYVEKERLGDEIARLNNKPHYYLLEHGAYFKVGRKWVMFQAQWSFYHGLYVNPATSPIQKFTMSWMIGLVLKPNVFGEYE